MASSFLVQNWGSFSIIDMCLMFMHLVQLFSRGVSVTWGIVILMFVLKYSFQVLTSLFRGSRVWIGTVRCMISAQFVKLLFAGLWTTNIQNPVLLIFLVLVFFVNRKLVNKQKFGWKITCKTPSSRNDLWPTAWFQVI